MEHLYEYVKAYEILIYSADADMICNPTNIDVWIKLNGEKVKIPARETIKA